MVNNNPITLDELLEKDLHLITYTPRYGGGPDNKVGVFIAGNMGNLLELAMMADAMTDSGDYCGHIKNMLYGTPYFPWGEGATFQEAVDRALASVNAFPREQWFASAYYEVGNAPSLYHQIRESYREWPPLISIEEAVKKWQM